jgi:fructokinase
MKYGWLENHMKLAEIFDISNPKLKCTGTGLVTLDIVSKANDGLNLRFWTGGSCGNVLIILAYLGWESNPIVRLGDDVAGQFLLKEMKSFGLKCNQVFLSKSISTPIIVEELSNGTNRAPSHRWKWTCPVCGSRLPAYKPIPVDELNAIRKGMPSCEIFYFDRVSRSAIELAKTCKSRGATVFFEPSTVGNKELFKECLKVADIVKYSHSRTTIFRKLLNDFLVPIEVETMGAKGVRYRIGTSTKDGKWVVIPAYHLKYIKDSAGCGDWCSAGMIHILGVLTNGHLQNVTHEVMEYSLKFGQTLAALKCYFEGARGLMYNMSKENLKELVKRAWVNTGLFNASLNGFHETHSTTLNLICPNCRSSK